MSQASLQNKIVTEIKALYGEPQDADKLDEFAEAISKAIVDWFENDAQSLPGTFTSSGSPVSGEGELVG